MLDPELRFGPRVSEWGAGLAWLELPLLDPLRDAAVLETGRFIAENRARNWRTTLASGVVGYASGTEGVSGRLLWSHYNPTPSGAAASTTTATGAAYYSRFRSPSSSVSPSGFVVEQGTRPIRILPPEPTGGDAWQLRVEDGRFVRPYVMPAADHSWLRHLFDPDDELLLYYSVPEALLIPHYPDVIADRDRAALSVSGMLVAAVDAHRVQLPGSLLAVTSLTVNGVEQILAASGHLHLEATLPRGPFRQWDPETGLLSLVRGLSRRDEVRASYRYREHRFTFDGYRSDDGTFHDLDLNPTPGHTFDQGTPSRELLQRPVYVYLLPAAAVRIQRADGTLEQEQRIYSGLRWTRSFLRWELGTRLGVTDSSTTSGGVFDGCRSRNTFGYSYFGSATFGASVPQDTFRSAASSAAYGAPALSGLADFPCAVILAKVQVTHPSLAAGVRVRDTRVRGGGLPESVDPADLRLPGETRREAETYWDTGDTWDGSPVPLAGVVLVELPQGILAGENGYEGFSRTEVEEIVRAHCAAGVRPLVQYID